LFFTNGKAGDAPQEPTEIAVKAIVPAGDRARRAYDDRGFAELVSSVKRTGSVDPIVVRPVGNVFELVLGGRRLAAARLAGLKRVPAVVRDVDGREMAVMRFVEELQDSTLSPIEEARGYRRLSKEFGITQAEIGRCVGKSQSTIANKLRLLRLPESIQARIDAEGVTERHARALLDLDDETIQNQVLDRVRDHNLSVRETEDFIRKISPAGGRSGRGSESSSGQGGRRVRKKKASNGTAAAGLFDDAGVVNGARVRGAADLDRVSNRRAIRAFRDIRLFLNTFRRAVEILKESGVAARMTENDTPEGFEVRVWIPRAQTGSLAAPGRTAPAGGAARGRSAGPEAGDEVG